MLSSVRLKSPVTLLNTPRCQCREPSRRIDLRDGFSRAEKSNGASWPARQSVTVGVSVEDHVAMLMNMSSRYRKKLCIDALEHGRRGMLAAGWGAKNASTHCHD